MRNGTKREETFGRFTKEIILLFQNVSKPDKDNGKKKKVLFICTHNSARSQMAEGLLNSLYGDRYGAYSAGTNPTEVNEYAIKVMSEIGIDISHQEAKSINDFKREKFNYVITLCNQAKNTCPFFPGAENYTHKGFNDPSTFEGFEEEVLEEFRNIRDEIRKWIEGKFGREV